MDIEKVRNAQSQEEAREYAIEWQHWASECSLSINELIQWHDVFITLAGKFGLEDEFKENGII